MKSTALILAATLLLYSPVLALDRPSVIVEEDPQVVLPQRTTPLVEDEPAAKTQNRPAVLVQDDSDSAPQAEPQQQPEQPPADPPPEEQAQPEEQQPEQPPEPPPQPEEQPEEQPQQQAPPEEPVPMPAPPETNRQSTPKVAQASSAGYQVIESKPIAPVDAAPVQQTTAASPAVSAPAPTQHEYVEPEQSAAPASEPAEQNDQQIAPTYMSEIASDFRYTVNNVEADAEDIVTAPLHIDKAGSLFVEPGFYYTVLGAGAGLGGAFALDQTARAHLRHMGYGLADDFETGGNFFVYGGTGLLYLWGLQSADANLREHEITGAESSGIASLLTIAFKNAFGRLRPHQGHGHFAFFDGGDSFVSSAATPVFALAAATSEAYDNRWYVALPAYAGAAAVGVGRMGKDDHWLSDIVGSALLGVGTTELMLYMHRRHAENPSRFRIFPVSAPNSGAIARQGGSQSIAPQGLGVSYNW